MRVGARDVALVIPDSKRASSWISGRVAGADGRPLADVNVGILLIFAVSSLNVYAIVLGGYASNNKYSLLGGLRSAAQLISYEMALGLALVPTFMIAGCAVHARCGSRGDEAASKAVSDAQGRFTLRLLPGSYRPSAKIFRS